MNTFVTVLAFINAVGLIALGVRNMTTWKELAQDVGATTERLKKVETEQQATKTKVDELQAIIDSQGESVPQEVIYKFAELKAQVERNDAVIADVVPTEQPGQPAEG